MKTNFENRSFQFWQYRVSHGELLVRSPRGGTNTHNVDLRFVGVDYVDVARTMLGLHIEDPTAEDHERAEERLAKKLSLASVFVLVSQGRRFLIVAARMSVNENELDIFESPFG